MRKYLIAGNWKMNKTASEAKKLVGDLLPLIKGNSVNVAIAPSFLAIPAVAEMLKGTEILLAAQNMSHEESGAHTGESSVLMLKDLGVKMVILGHSERRHIYREMNELINKKVKLALKHELTVNLCIGETLEEREAGNAEIVCFKQLEECLQGIPEKDLSKLFIAYEPVWAIGTGKTATPEDAEAIHMACRKKVAQLYNADIAEKMIIQYGGSVKPDNVKKLMAMSNIDGGLIGGASLTAESFAALVNFNK